MCTGDARRAISTANSETRGAGKLTASSFVGYQKGDIYYNTAAHFADVVVWTGKANDTLTVSSTVGYVFFSGVSLFFLFRLQNSRPAFFLLVSSLYTVLIAVKCTPKKNSPVGAIYVVPWLSQARQCLLRIFLKVHPLPM